MRVQSTRYDPHGGYRADKTPGPYFRHEHIGTLANLITLGARDFSSLRGFYRNLGWPQIIDDGQFAAFELRGIVLALFPITQPARDGNAEPEPGTGGIRFTRGVMVDAADEVGWLTEQMRRPAPA